jgi:hypothetical protein
MVLNPMIVDYSDAKRSRSRYKRHHELMYGFSVRAKNSEQKSETLNVFNAKLHSKSCRDGYTIPVCILSPCSSSSFSCPRSMIKWKRISLSLLHIPVRYFVFDRMNIRTLFYKILATSKFSALDSSTSSL